ncbi:MAG: DUF72 domain-containing protein [Deltaproteobacteria bacterium]|nr:DUF72 domain-containing protein [Deltaproteobacteria bacterium]
MSGHPPEGLFDFEAAAKLPTNILFGTSSWNYPGWMGTVYREHYKDEKDLRARSLIEYSQFPWFRTVGIDSSFYGPPALSTLTRYASQVPADFEWCTKVWDTITIPRFPKIDRYKDRAGQVNATFLDPQAFTSRVAAAFSHDEIRQHTGVFILQFPRITFDQDLSPQTFLERLGAFLGSIPTDFRYAVELRNESLLIPEYFEVLNAHGVTHCFNHWSQMPPLHVQMTSSANAGGLSAPFYVARILTPLGMKYEDAVRRFQPYEYLQAPIPHMRADLIRLARRGLEKNVKVYILVNNRSEGYAPGTIDSVGRELVRSLEVQ